MNFTATNCQGGGNNVQAGIYDNCINNWMALKCQCTGNGAFNLTSNNFIPGEIYYIFIDGCSGADCDIAIDVTAGTTEQQPPGVPGPINGPIQVCTNTTHAYSIAPTTFTTAYEWTINPPLGTTSSMGATANIVWGNTPGIAEVCVMPVNQCLDGQPVCKDVEVFARPTANISGNGVLCAVNGGGTPDPVDIPITFTGDGPWTFTIRLNGVNQTTITTTDNPYIYEATQPGTYTIVNLSGGPVPCSGTVTGSAVITLSNMNLTQTNVASTCGQSNGSINLSHTGGTAPYTYVWSGGQTTQDLSNIPGGPYSVTVTDANDCTKELQINVNDNQININISGAVTANTTCLPPGNGAINVTITPSNPYDIEWSNGETTEDLSNLPPGDYTITATYGVNCTQTQTFTVPDNPITPVLTHTTVSSLCELANGSADLSVSGGVAPYTYDWSNGTMTQDLTNALAGSYTVTVTGANGCTDTEDVTIDNNNPPIDVTGAVTANTSCNPPGTGSINVTVGPANLGPFNYEWSSGQTTQDLSGVPGGSYTITVTGIGACTADATFDVEDQPNEPNVSYTTTQPVCGNSAGGINVSVSGGTTPYNYLWSSGQNTQDLTNIPAGTYTVTVTGSNGCTDEETIQLDDNNPSIDVTANITSNTSCNPPGNGSINVSVSPTGTYTYEWSSGQTTQDLNNQPGGTYSITVTLGVNCTEVQTFEIPDDPNVPDLSYTTTTAVCETNTGAINLSVSGGVPTYTYNWSSGQTTQDLTAIPPGNYTVTVTGANGCTATEDINVDNDNPPIDVTAQVTTNTSCNPPGNGAINVSVSPANVGPFTYLWSSGQTTQDLTNQPGGTYTITVTGQGVCTAEATFDISDDPNLPNLSYTVTPSSCGQNNGAINLSVSGGVPTYTYNWSSGQTTQDLTNIPEGDYTVTVTGANGCTAEETINVNDDNPGIDINANITANTTCNGGNGSITVTVQPPGAYTFTWSTGQTTATINQLPPGSYSVTVGLGGNCGETADFEIEDNPILPELEVSSVEATCELANGSVNLTVSPGVPPYQYLWSSGQTTQDLSTVPPGDYTVTVTGANGCTQTADVNVGNENPPINITAFITDNTSCTGENGSINVSVNPPSMGPFTYEWSSGQTTQDISNIPVGTYTITVNGKGSCTGEETFDVGADTESPELLSNVTPALCGNSNGKIDLSVSQGQAPYTYEWASGQTTQDLNNLPPDFYQVTVTDALGCTSELFVEVPDDFIDIIVDWTLENVTSCLAPNGEIDLDYTPTNLQLTWSDPALGSNSNPTGLEPGFYSVTLSAGGTCTAEFSFEIKDDSEQPNLSTAVSPATCGVNNGAIDLTVTGSVTPYIFKWSSGQTTQNLTNIPPGNYTVTVTSATGCSAEIAASVPNNTISIQIAANTTDDVSCIADNGSIDLSISPTGTYVFNWASGQTTEDIANLAPGSYTVSVTQGVNCTATGTFAVLNANVSPNLSASGVPATCNLPNGAANASVSGGAPPYTYSWSNGSASQNLTNLPPMSYALTVSDLNGCTTTATADVPNNDLVLNLSENIAENSSCTTPNGSINLTVTPAGTYTYTWALPGGGSAATEDLQNLAPGIYAITVSAGGTCSASANFLVGENTIEPTIAPAVTPAICNQSNGGISLVVGAAPGPFNFSWSSAANTQDLTSILPGNYSVTVTAANGCTKDTTLNVPNNASTFSLSGTARNWDNCIGLNTGIDLVVTPSGSYNYAWSDGSISEDLVAILPGTYTCTVTEVGDCAATISFIIEDQRTYPTLSHNLTPEICGLKNGSIELDVFGGATPYSYAWSSGQTTEDLAGIPGNTYIVTVSGSNDCTAEATVVVPENTIPFSISGSATANTSCLSPNGSVQITLAPSTPGSGLNYVFNWASGQTTEDLANISAGNYEVTVVVGATCTNTATYNVGNDAGAPLVSGSVVAAECGKSIGSVDVSITDGTPPFTFKWASGQVSEDLTSIPSGNYAITVTAANGCTGTAAFVVPENDIIPSVSGTSMANTACKNPNGSLDISVSPASSYTFTWSSGQTTQNLANIPAGSYTVTVNGGGGCVAEAIFTVPDDSGAPQLTGTHEDILCFGEKTGSIDLTVNGGTAPFEFDWTPNLPDQPDQSSLAAGSFSVVVTDALDCTATADFEILQPAAAVQVACNQLNTVSEPGKEDGRANVNLTGGTLPYRLDWQPGSGSQANLLDGDFEMKDLAAGDYFITVTDANGCTALCNFTIGIAGCITAVGTMSLTGLSDCSSGCLTATYNSTGQVLDPDDKLQFILHEAPGTNIVNEIARSTTPKFCFNKNTMSYGTTYYIAVAAGNANAQGNVLLNAYCSVVGAGTPVVWKQKPVAAIEPPDDLNCKIKQVPLEGSADMTNSTFAWTTLGGQILGAANQADATAGLAGTYNLFVENNGCRDTATVVVKDASNNPVAKVAASPDDILDCKIDEIELTGTVEGSLAANTVWKFNGQIFANATTIKIEEPGTYFFVIVDTLTFCADSAILTIDENIAYPLLDVAPPGILTCENQTVTLSGGSPFPGIQFQWGRVVGTDTTIVGSGPSFAVSQPGQYVLIGTDPVNGCKNSTGTEVLADKQAPDAEAGQGFTMPCFGSTSGLDGSASTGAPNLEFDWTTSDGILVSGKNTATPTVGEPGTYRLVVTNPANGCTDTDAVTIGPEPPIGGATVVHPLCEGEEGRILIENLTGAKPPVRFSLDGGQTYTNANVFNDLVPGDYTILVLDAEGCSTTMTATVNEPEPLIVTLDSVATISLGYDYRLEAQVNVPTNQLQSIVWTPSENLLCDSCLTTIAMPTRTIRYTITVSNTDGCEDKATLLLKVERDYKIYVPNIFSPDGDGINDQFYIFADPKLVLKINAFQIYSRWGELVAERYDFSPNDPAQGWDGNHRDKPLNPGVFAWWAEVLFVDGTVEFFKGDVTVKR